MADDDATVHRPETLLTELDGWYRRHARNLPWRVGPHERDRGVRPDPYLVWLSEIMLQQTTAPHAAPYFERFKARWPSIEDLAKASWEELSAAWAGLGYYRRAQNLHACAKAVVLAGGFPQDLSGLRKLPGVGPYTASAIAAIAFEQASAPVDGNIERVVSRLYAIGSDASAAGWRAAKIVIADRAQRLFDAASMDLRPGDLAQALMDLGATVCTPKKPNCPVCPLARACAGRETGEPERYPVKAARKARPTRYGAAFLAFRDDCVFLARREDGGLLGGMLMPLTGPWREGRPKDRLDGAPAGLAWIRAGEVRHVFTHFALILDVFEADGAPPSDLQGEWVQVEHARRALPSVGRKALELALGGASTRRRAQL